MGGIPTPTPICLQPIGKQKAGGSQRIQQDQEKINLILHPVGKLHFPMQEVWIQSLVGELRSLMPQGEVKEKEKNGGKKILRENRKLTTGRRP